mgnify:CR=1 FL=1
MYSILMLNAHTDYVLLTTHNNNAVGFFTFSALGGGAASTYDTKIDSVFSHHTKCTMREETPSKNKKQTNKKS